MQTLAVGDYRTKPATVCLHDETEGLDALHRGWMQHVAAWRLAHEAAVDNAKNVLARIDALIASLETP